MRFGEAGTFFTVAAFFGDAGAATFFGEAGAETFLAAALADTRLAGTGSGSGSGAAFFLGAALLALAFTVVTGDSSLSL